MSRSHDVITVGTATRDVFLPLAGGIMRVEPGAKADCGSPIFSSGGGAVNAAVTFARQGFDVATACRIGSDSSGDDILRDLEREGVTARIVRDLKRATGYAAIALYPDGERSVIAHRGAADGLMAKDAAWGKAAPEWAYVAPGHIAPAAIGAVMKAARASKTNVAFNPSSWYLDNESAWLRSVLPQIAVFMVNRSEAARFLGVPPEDERGVFRRLDALTPGIAVMTDGPRGAWVSDGKKIYHAGIFANERVVDRTGAGDAFGSGFVAGLMGTGDVMQAIRLASANAAANVERVGAHAGVLTLREFGRDARWKNLQVTSTPL